MILYHATTPKKAKKYQQSGHIRKPVRGFDTLMGAMAWCIKTGRTVIYKIDTEDKVYYKLPDHHNSYGEAWWIDSDIDYNNIKCVRSKA